MRLKKDINRITRKGDCVYCGAKKSMEFQHVCFICSKCGNSINEDAYLRWSNGGNLDFEGENFHDLSYDDIYDEDGDEVLMKCSKCGSYILWKNGEYICPDCGTIVDRAELFNYIGAEPPGPECLKCDNLYPGCIVCPFGYIEED